MPFGYLCREYLGLVFLIFDAVIHYPDFAYLWRVKAFGRPKALTIQNRPTAWSASLTSLVGGAPSRRLI